MLKENMLRIIKYYDERGRLNTGYSQFYATELTVQLIIRQTLFDLTTKKVIETKDFSSQYIAQLTNPIPFSAYEFLIIDKECVSIENGQTDAEASIIFYSPNCCGAFTLILSSSDLSFFSSNLYAVKGKAGPYENTTFFMTSARRAFIMAQQVKINDILVCFVSFKYSRIKDVNYQIIDGPIIKLYRFQTKNFSIPLADPVVCWS